MRTVSARRSAAHRIVQLAVRQWRFEESQVRDSGERHVFERPVDSDTVRVLMRNHGMIRPSGAFAPGICQDQRAIPDRTQEHRPLKSCGAQQRQRNALQDAQRVKVHGHTDAQRQAGGREVPRGRRRRLEDDGRASAGNRIHLQPRAEPCEALTIGLARRWSISRGIHPLDELSDESIFVGVRCCLPHRRQRPARVNRNAAISSPLRTSRTSPTSTGWFQVLPSIALNRATSVN